MRTFYTIDDLYQFCKTNNFTRFSSGEHNNKPLIIQSIETFEAEDSANDGKLPVKLKSCHIGKNRNKSSISEESMNAYKNTFKGRPILAAFHKTDTGEWEFHSHDMKIVENEDGEYETEYIEQQVGVISEIEEPYLEYDAKEDKTYLMVSGNIFEDYTRAAEILQRRRTCKCSVEIAVHEMSWDVSEDVLSIDKFSFMGVTILGTEQDGVTLVEEGMKGSKITIDSFSENNSMFSTDYQNKLLETLEKLNNTLANFSINNTKSEEVSGTMNHFEELLAEYGVTVEDCDFDYENMTDEELDAKFAELFANNGDDNGESSDDGNENGEGEENNIDVVETEAKKKKRKCSIDENGDMSVTFEISHEDIRYALYNLIGIYEEEDNDWYIISNVYDGYFIMENWNGDKFYKQSYGLDGDNVSLSGDRQEMFRMMLTESEKLAIDKMRENYAALEEKYNELKSFKETYDAEVLKAAKDAIFDSVEYDEIRETDEFKALVKDAEKYSVDEIKVKCDLLFAASMKKKFNFNTKPEQKTAVVFNTAKPEKKKKAYGKLFKD